MKNILTIILCLTAGSAAWSQVEKGDFSLTVNGSYSKTGDVASLGLINAKLGRFVTKNVELGIKPQFMFSKGFNGTGMGVYSTYNFLTKDGKLLPYAGVELNFQNQSFDEGDDVDQTDLGLYAGTKLFLNEKINVDFGLNILSNMSNSADADLGTMVMFNIGIGFILGKK
ncbi:MAG: hypothetical protein MUC38_03420 [Cyclobacteriaceae bacterium]|jgi:hypothetical protein|nr:hypothetical protein [Cyclobacteriaceae bacterium]